MNISNKQRSDGKMNKEKLSFDEMQSMYFLDEDELKQIDFLRKIYRMLQLFCEGHNENMQNLLREQQFNNTKAVKSYNFIHQTSILFGIYIKFVNTESLDLGYQMLDFLVECIQGPCRQNQLDLIRSKIIDICKDLIMKYYNPQENEFIRLGFEHGDELKMFAVKSINLLVSLLEGTANKEIISNMIKSLDIHYLQEILYEEYMNAKNGQNFDEDIREAFDIYILLATLGNYDSQIQEKLKISKNRDQQQALQYFKYQTGQIEILFNNDLVRVYFFIEPECRLLSKNSRVKLMQNVTRDSANDKINGLLEASPELFDEMEHGA